MKKLILPTSILVVFVLIVNFLGLFTGYTYFGIDGNLGIIKQYSSAMWSMLNKFWQSTYLLGNQVGLNFNLSIFLSKVFGDKTPVFDVIVYMIVSFSGMFLFLRSSKVSFWASLFGSGVISLTTFGVLSVYGGHLNGSWGFVLLTLGITKYVYSNSLNYTKLLILSFLAGVSLGIAFADFQRTIYFGLVFAAYIIFLVLARYEKPRELLRERRENIIKFVIIPLVVLVTFVLFSINGIIGMFEFTKMEQVGVKKDDNVSKWQFLTQFSFPPEEILNFFVPGLFGYFSDESSDLPYWGRGGQDFGYAQTKKGMKNFRLGIDTHVGVFVLPFLLLAFIYFRNWEKERKRHFIFWLVVAILAFLLSLGRYFPPLFWLLVQIPFFDKLRNPGKWMDIFVISIVILASFSFDSFIRNLGKSSRENKLFLTYLFAYSGILLLAYLALLGIRQEIAFALTSPNALAPLGYNAAVKASENIVSSVGTTFLFVFFGTLILFGVEKLSTRSGFEPDTSEIKRDIVIPQGILVFFVLFAFLNMYLVVKPLFKLVDPKRLYEDNNLVSYLKKEFSKDPMRVAIFSGLANHYYTFLFPYNGLETIHTIPQSRLPEDYNSFISYLNIAPIAVMKVYGVKYVIVDLPPTTPQIAELKDLEYVTNINSVVYFGEGDSGPSTIQHSAYVYKLNGGLPKFYMTPNYIKYTGQFEFLLTLPTEVLKNSVLITNDIKDFIPSTNFSYNLKVEKYSPDYVKLSVENSDDGFLVANIYYSPQWQVFVNGVKREIMRANYLVQSVYLEKGKHVVEFKFDGFSYFAILQLVLLVVFVILGGYVIYFSLSRK